MRVIIPSELEGADLYDANGEYVPLEEVATRDKRIAKLEAALAWYGEQARLCRLIHSEGDEGRQSLAADGGTRARTALTKST